MNTALQQPVHFILLYVVMPAWLLAGVADWACHRRTDIAHTSGIKESLLHLVMIGQGGLAVLAVMFLRVNAAVLLLLAVLLAAHALTLHWDLHSTTGKREIAPIEQTVHALLEALPMSAFALVVASHWSQSLAMFGAGDAQPDWRLMWKAEALPSGQIVAVLLGSFFLGTLPYLEELMRSWKARRT
jgi:hypothetical protein